MFNLEVLNVVIGLVFIYLLYSLLATILQEFVATYIFNLRANVLALAIVRMLEDTSRLANSRVNNLFRLKYSNIVGGIETFSGQFYNHALIKFLGEDNSRKLSYLTRDAFSKVLIDLLRGTQAELSADTKSLIQSTLQSRLLKAPIGVPIGGETLSFLKSLWLDAQGDVDKFRALLEKWFDETMDRASGWYKKYTQIILPVIGLVLAMAFNVNTIEIVHKLEKDPELRAQIVAQADNFLQAHPDLDKELALMQNRDLTGAKQFVSPDLKEKDSLTAAQLELFRARRDTLISIANRVVKADIDKTHDILGFGWNGWKDFFIALFTTWSIFGWLITAFAVSLGAPFWFDLLNKLMKLRSSLRGGEQKEKKQE